MTTAQNARPRRLQAGAAALLAATLSLTGCLHAGGSSGDRPATSAPPHTEGIPAELLPFYEQTLEWRDCGSGRDCTVVSAPLDWEHPDAAAIELSVVRHRAATAPRGSLLTNPGGPGASGVDLIMSSLGMAVGDALQKNYDVIGFDPRGVGQSTAVSCLDTAEMDEYLYGIPTARRGTLEWEVELTERQRHFAAACESASEGILPFITTINAARDMDLIRGVLGDPELNYLGYSYGTFLGATYAMLYPERSGRLVLDGAIDPAVSGLDVGATQAIGFEAALRAFMAACLSSGECPFAGSVDEAMTDLGALLASADRRPIENGDGRMLGANTLVTAIVSALYSQDNWEYLTQALSGVLQGDPYLAFVLADFYNGREGGVYADNSAEAFAAYNCMDYPLEPDPGAQEAARQRIADGAPTIAPYWDGPDVCEVWPHPPSGQRGPIRAEGAGPILVIGTTNDPATPYDWSVALAGQLEGGVLITRVGEGHTGYNKGNVCVDRAVEAFFLDGVVPEDGLRCE